MFLIENIDCLEFMSKVESETFDLIIADPPYFQIFGDFDFAWSNIEEYLCWCKKWIEQFHRILRPNGSVYLWGAIGYTKGYPLFKLVDWIEEKGLFKVINWITQRNTRGYGNKKGFVAAREELVFMVKGDEYTWNPVYLDEETRRKDLGCNGKPRKNKFKRCTDVWIDITEANQSSKERFKTSDEKSFPTVKSLKLCERIIKASTNPGDTVYIPFGGSGSEAVACILNNRNFMLTEVNKSYVEEIIQPRIFAAKSSL